MAGMHLDTGHGHIEIGARLADLEHVLGLVECAFEAGQLLDFGDIQIN